jgi:hypothetical protein
VLGWLLLLFDDESRLLGLYLMALYSPTVFLMVIRSFFFCPFPGYCPTCCFSTHLCGSAPNWVFPAKTTRIDRYWNFFLFFVRSYNSTAKVAQAFADCPHDIASDSRKSGSG